MTKHRAARVGICDPNAELCAVLRRHLCAIAVQRVSTPVINYLVRTVIVREVLTHPQYDRDQWKVRLCN